MLLVVWPGAPSSVHAPGSRAQEPLVASMFLVARAGALVASLLLVAMPGAPSSPCS